MCLKASFVLSGKSGWHMSTLQDATEGLLKSQRAVIDDIAHHKPQTSSKQQHGGLHLDLVAAESVFAHAKQQVLGCLYRQSGSR